MRSFGPIGGVYTDPIQSISTVAVSLPVLKTAKGQLDAIDVWLRSVLWHGKMPGGGGSDQGSDVDDDTHDNASQQVDVHRLKGRLVLDDGQVKLIQGVREIFEIVDSTDQNQGAGSKIVLIGRRLNPSFIEKSLLAVLR